jgi:Transglutaminase-like superfamily
MNRGNVMYDGCHCRFLDWRDAYVGNPFVGLEHLLLLNSPRRHEQEEIRLKRVYKTAWQDRIPLSAVDAALTLMPVVAGVSALYGRGDWLQSEHRDSPGRQRYARSVARHMDRALRSPQLSDLLTSRAFAGYTGALPGSAALGRAVMSREEEQSRPTRLTQFYSWNSDDALQAMRYRMDRLSRLFHRRLGLLTSSCSYAWLLCESWLLLWFTEFYMRLGGAKAVHGIVEKQRTIVSDRHPEWSSVQLCHALDLACVFYFKRVRCLQHSSALTLLLRWHGWKAEMVIGARIFPTSFHAWTQIGDAVVNDGSHVLASYQVLKRC